jgi:hypothetical protein
VSGLRINPAKCELFMKGFEDQEALDILHRFQEILPGIQIVTQ